jgi:hypothetical protein
VLKLRRGRVASTEPLEVEIEGERRPAWADEALVGPCELGDQVVVNTAALDLGLGSGGFDVVHVNLTRGLEGGGGPGGAHVIKLNYTSLQHPVEPVEPPEPVEAPERPRPGRRPPLLVLPLHGHLAPAGWALAWARPGARVGFVQTTGGALPGALSRDAEELCERGLLVERISVAPCYGGGLEAISLPGALHAAAEEFGWEAVIAGPGPGVLGSASRYGHGGMAALESAHAGLALGLPTLLSPRLSSADHRPRHRGLSHHTRSVLELLLVGVSVAVPAQLDELWPADAELGALSAACGERHRELVEPADLERYAGSGLPRRTMGRELEEDPLFFAAPLAAGAALGGLLGAA